MRSTVSTRRMIVAGIVGTILALVAAGFCAVMALLIALSAMSDNCRDSTAGVCSASGADSQLTAVIIVALSAALLGTMLAIWAVLGRERRGVGAVRLIGASAALVVGMVALALGAVASDHAYISLWVVAGLIALAAWARAAAEVFTRKLSP